MLTKEQIKAVRDYTRKLPFNRGYGPRVGYLRENNRPFIKEEEVDVLDTALVAYDLMTALLDEWEGAAEADDVFSGKKVCAVLRRALEG